MADKVSINEQIKAGELRVIGVGDSNLGVISRDDAIKAAQDAGLDLIEISPKANPPVAKIMDYGKFQYTQKKKESETRAKTHTTETKNVQIKIGTGEHDLDLKAKRVSGWLKEGHRVKVDLFLRGRAKYMEQSFLKERIHRFLRLVTEEHKIADDIKKSPKGLSTTIERVGKKASQASKEQATPAVEAVK